MEIIEPQDGVSLDSENPALVGEQIPAEGSTNFNLPVGEAGQDISLELGEPETPALIGNLGAEESSETESKEENSENSNSDQNNGIGENLEILEINNNNSSNPSNLEKNTPPSGIEFVDSNKEELPVEFSQDSENKIGGELLVQAKSHWMDDLTQVEVNKLNADEKQSYEARGQVGDIIVVRPAGWKWGKEEGLPNYILVKIPDAKVEDIKHYEESLIDTTDAENPKIIRERKYAISKLTVENAIKNTNNNITIDKTTLENILIIKTGAISEINLPSKNIIYIWYKKAKLYFNIVSSYLIKPAYAAASQLKKTVKPSGGDYTSLEACMHANEQNLVTADKYFDVEIDGDWSGGPDTTQVTVGPYTTDSTHDIHIYTIGDARHNGIYGDKTTAYILAPGNVHSMQSGGIQYLTIEGLQINTATTSSYHSAWHGASSGAVIIIKNCILKCSGTLTTGIAVHIDTTVTLNIYNTIFIDWQYSGYGALTHDSNHTADNYYNLTIHNCSVGIKSRGSFVTAINVLTQACGDGFSGSTWSANTDYNLSDIASDAPGTNSRNGADGEVTFVNEVGDDFHLASDDGGAKDYGDGTSLSGTFTDDIDGDTRSGTWDIGADEYIAPASTPSYIPRPPASGTGTGPAIY